MRKAVHSSSFFLGASLDNRCPSRECALGWSGRRSEAGIERFTVDTASLSDEKDTGRWAALGSIGGTGVASGAVASSLIAVRGLPLSLLLSLLDNDVLLLRAGFSAVSLIMLCRNEFLRLVREPLADAVAPSIGLSGATDFRGEGDREVGIHDRRRSREDRELEGVGRSESSSWPTRCDLSVGVLVSLFLFAVALVVASCGRLFLSTVDFDGLTGSTAISRGVLGSESGEVSPEEVSEPLPVVVVLSGRKSSMAKEASCASKKESVSDGKYV